MPRHVILQDIDVHKRCWQLEGREGGCFRYGNTGCGVFKWGGTKLERFLPKNQHTQRIFLNFENWTNGEPQ